MLTILCTLKTHFLSEYSVGNIHSVGYITFQHCHFTMEI